MSEIQGQAALADGKLTPLLNGIEVLHGKGIARIVGKLALLEGESTHASADRMAQYIRGLELKVVPALAGLSEKHQQDVGGILARSYWASPHVRFAFGKDQPDPQQLGLLAKKVAPLYQTPAIEKPFFREKLTSALSSFAAAHFGELSTLDLWRARFRAHRQAEEEAENWAARSLR